MSTLNRLFTKLASALALAIAPTFAQAQSEPLAYGIDIIPFEEDIRTAVGLSVYSLPRTRFGYYGTLYASLAFEDPYYDDLERGAFGDAVTDEFQYAYGFNVGIAGRLNDSLALFGGVGYGWLEGQVEQFDPTLTLSDDGAYFVDDPSNDDEGFDLQVGAIASIGTASLSLSYHTFFETISFGIGTSF